MDHREELELALAEAEVQLAEAVEARARLDTGTAEVNANIERARAHCRHARAALAELGRTELERRESEFVPEGSTGPLAGGGRKPAERTQRRAVHRLIGGFLAREFVAKGAPDWRLIARQAFMLLALVLAYLQYYFFDVHLQLARLPALVVPLLSSHPLT